MQLRDFPRKVEWAHMLIRFAVRLLILVIFAMFGSVGFGRSLAALLWMSTHPQRRHRHGETRASVRQRAQSLG